MNVPPSVINAARQGLILIVSAPDPAGKVHKWRSRLTDSGFLLTAEDGARFLMPVLDGEPQMIREDLVPALHFYLARVQLEIERGDEAASTFYAARLVSIINENPDTSAGWYDARFMGAAKAAIVARHPERFKTPEELKVVADETAPWPPPRSELLRGRRPR